MKDILIGKKVVMIHLNNITGRVLKRCPRCTGCGYYVVELEGGTALEVHTNHLNILQEQKSKLIKII